MPAPWANLGPTSNNAAIQALNAAPFHEVAVLAGLGWLGVVLRIDAIVSPCGYRTDLPDLGIADPVALSKNGYIPQTFENVSGRARVPVTAILLTSVVGLMFLLPFPSWAKLVGVVTSASVLMYAGAPLALGALRLQKPDLPRSYRMPAAGFLSPAAFAAASLIVYFSGWTTYSTLMVALLLGYLLIGISFAFHLNPDQPPIDWGAAPWVLSYLVGMGIISYFGDFGDGGIIGPSVGIFSDWKTTIVRDVYPTAGNSDTEEVQRGTRARGLIILSRVRSSTSISTRPTATNPSAARIRRRHRAVSPHARASARLVGERRRTAPRRRPASRRGARRISPRARARAVSPRAPPISRPREG